MARQLRTTIIISKKLSRAGARVAALLQEIGKPILSQYELYHVIGRLYENPEGLYLRQKNIDRTEFDRIKANLRAANIIAKDADYGARAYRVNTVPDLPAEEICCLVDPSCYVSHLSALQRYGLTNRRPVKLTLSRPSNPGRKDKPKSTAEWLPPQITSHPDMVRGRKIQLAQTSSPGATITLRGTSIRIATVGRCFRDMLSDPELCGGMAHVVSIWKQHAPTYLEEILREIDACDAAIVKVRAGFILEAELGIQDDTIQSWEKFAQRGGSRRLDPEKPYKAKHSEKWMLSINV